MDVPIRAAGIASFDMVSGIKVVHHWSFSSDVSPINLTSLFKIVLSNVHRQGNQAYTEPTVSTVEMPTLNWFLVSSIFLFETKRHNIHYSVGLIFDFQKFPMTPEFLDIVISWSKILANVAKGFLGLNRSLAGLKTVIDFVCDDITTVLRSSLPQSPPLEIDPLDSVLYARLLTSLFETHMTVVIESASAKPDHAQQIGGLLSHFCLAHQRRFSTLELLPRASPHLYVQCVYPQTHAHLQDLMLWFDRPVTWVRLPDRRGGAVKVLKSSASLDEQKVCHERFIHAHFVQTDEAGRNATLNIIRERLQIEDLLVPAPWCLGRVVLLVETPLKLRWMFCAEQLAAVMRIAIAVVAIVKVKNGQTSGEGTEKEIKTALGLVGQVDWEMFVALARLFDKDVQTKLRALGGWATTRRG